MVVVVVGFHGTTNWKIMHMHTCTQVAHTRVTGTRIYIYGNRRWVLSYKRQRMDRRGLAGWLWGPPVCIEKYG